MQEHDGVSQRQTSITANKITFQPVQTKFSVPPGAFLAPKNQSSDGDKPYISKSGFENLATSSYFIKCVREDVDKLLNTFVREWKQQTEALSENALEVNNTVKGKRKATWPVESPFQIFKRLFEEQGWHLAQLFWSENDATRLAMYTATIRIFAEPLQSIVPSTSEADPDHDLLLRACGGVFAMYLLQSTAIIEERYRHTPGYRVRLPLEADLLLFLNNLPHLSSTFLQHPIDQDGLRPIDDLIFVLRELQAPSNLGAHESIHGSSVDVLLPTQYQTRPAIISTKFTTRSEVDREEGEYGSIRDLEKNTTHSLSRIEMAHTLVRKAIGMPLLSMKPSDNDDDESSKVNRDRYLVHKLNVGDLAYDPSSKVRQSTHWRSTHYVGTPTTTQQDKFATLLEGLNQVRGIYKDQVRATFGKDILTFDENVSGKKSTEGETKANRLKSKIMSRAKSRTRKQIAERLHSATEKSRQK